MPIPNGPMNRMSNTMFTNPAAMEHARDSPGLPATMRNWVVRYCRMNIGANAAYTTR